MNLKEAKSKSEINCILPVLILWIFGSCTNQEEIKLPHLLNTWLNIIQSIVST